MEAFTPQVDDVAVAMVGGTPQPWWRLERRRRTQAQQRLRTARLQEVRKLWRSLAQVTLGLGVYTACVLLIPWPRSEALFSAGVVDGAGGMAVCWLISTRTYMLTMGAWAESWTSELFGKCKGWRIVDNLPVDGYDLDHIVIAPAGVLAVETKYYGPLSIGQTSHSDRLKRDMTTAKSRAWRAAQLLASEDIGQPVSVRPVLVVWGVGVTADLEVDYQAGVWVVDGNRPEKVFQEFGASRLDPQRARDIERALRFWARRQIRPAVLHGDTGAAALRAPL